MGVRTLLSSVRRDVTSTAYEIWEEADSSVVQYIGDSPVGGGGGAAAAADSVVTVDCMTMDQLVNKINASSF